MENLEQANIEKSSTEKREEMLAYYIKRNAVIKDKYSNMQEAPETVQKEQRALKNMISALKNSRRKTVWSRTESSDGLDIDSFQQKVYEEALEEYNNCHEENLTYITKEDEENFKFGNLNYDAIRKQMETLKTAEDVNWFVSRYEYNPDRTSLEMQDELDRIIAEAFELNLPTEAELEYNETKETTDVQENIKLPVQESKFAQIYGKAKGRLKEAFSKLKNAFNRDRQVGIDDKENANDNEQR